MGERHHFFVVVDYALSLLDGSARRQLENRVALNDLRFLEIKRVLKLLRIERVAEAQRDDSGCEFALDDREHTENITIVESREGVHGWCHVDHLVLVWELYLEVLVARLESVRQCIDHPVFDTLLVGDEVVLAASGTRCSLHQLGRGARAHTKSVQRG